MLNLNELISIATADGVDVKTVERDYVLTHLIAELSKAPKADSFVFKGGTALRLVHFERFRYSADIDLNVTLSDAFTRTDALDQIADSAATVGRAFGFDISFDGGGLRYIAQRQQRRPEHIKVDLNIDELPTDAPVRLPIIARYRDQVPVASLPTYGLLEAAAEKLRCVMQRALCRDVYDLHRLLIEEQIGTLEEVWHQFQAKARHRGHAPEDFTASWAVRKPTYRTRWDQEMARYTPNPPEFDRVTRELERTFRALG